MRSLAQLRAHARSVIEETQAGRQQEAPFLHVAGGGGGTPLTWKICKITGFTAGNTALRCKDVDATGAPVGTAFTVYVWSLSEQTNQIGVLDLTNSDRRYAVDMFVRVWSQQMPFVLGTTPITGWVAVHDALEVCQG